MADDFENFAKATCRSWCRFRTNWDAIIAKYDRPFDCDEVDLSSMAVIKDSGELRSHRFHTRHFGHSRLASVKDRKGSADHDVSGPVDSGLGTIETWGPGSASCSLSISPQSLASEITFANSPSPEKSRLLKVLEASSVNLAALQDLDDDVLCESDLSDAETLSSHSGSDSESDVEESGATTAAATPSQTDSTDDPASTGEENDAEYSDDLESIEGQMIVENGHTSAVVEKSVPLLRQPSLESLNSKGVSEESDTTEQEYASHDDDGLGTNSTNHENKESFAANQISHEPQAKNIVYRWPFRKKLSSSSVKLSTNEPMRISGGNSLHSTGQGKGHDSRGNESNRNVSHNQDCNYEEWSVEKNPGIFESNSIKHFLSKFPVPNKPVQVTPMATSINNTTFTVEKTSGSRSRHGPNKNNILKAIRRISPILVQESEEPTDGSQMNFGSFGSRPLEEEKVKTVNAMPKFLAENPSMSIKTSASMPARFSNFLHSPKSWDRACSDQFNFDGCFEEEKTPTSRNADNLATATPRSRAIKEIFDKLKLSASRKTPCAKENVGEIQCATEAMSSHRGSIIRAKSRKRLDMPGVATEQQDINGHDEDFELFEPHIKFRQSSREQDMKLKSSPLKYRVIKPANLLRSLGANIDAPTNETVDPGRKRMTNFSPLKYRVIKPANLLGSSGANIDAPTNETVDPGRKRMTNFSTENIPEMDYTSQHNYSDDQVDVSDDKTYYHRPSLTEQVQDDSCNSVLPCIHSGDTSDSDDTNESSVRSVAHGKSPLTSSQKLSVSHSSLAGGATGTDCWQGGGRPEQQRLSNEPHSSRSSPARKMMSPNGAASARSESPASVFAKLKLFSRNSPTQGYSSVPAKCFTSCEMDPDIRVNRTPAPEISTGYCKQIPSGQKLDPSNKDRLKPVVPESPACRFQMLKVMAAKSGVCKGTKDPYGFRSPGNTVHQYRKVLTDIKRTVYAEENSRSVMPARNDCAQGHTMPSGGNIMSPDAENSRVSERSTSTPRKSAYPAIDISCISVIDPPELTCVQDENQMYGCDGHKLNPSLKLTSKTHKKASKNVPSITDVNPSRKAITQQREFEEGNVAKSSVLESVPSKDSTFLVTGHSKKMSLSSDGRPTNKSKVANGKLPALVKGKMGELAVPMQVWDSDTSPVKSAQCEWDSLKKKILPAAIKKLNLLECNVRSVKKTIVSDDRENLKKDRILSMETRLPKTASQEMEFDNARKPGEVGSCRSHDSSPASKSSSKSASTYSTRLVKSSGFSDSVSSPMKTTPKRSLSAHNNGNDSSDNSFCTLLGSNTPKAKRKRFYSSRLSKEDKIQGVYELSSDSDESYVYNSRYSSVEPRQRKTLVHHRTARRSLTKEHGEFRSEISSSRGEPSKYVSPSSNLGYTSKKHSFPRSYDTGDSSESADVEQNGEELRKRQCFSDSRKQFTGKGGRGRQCAVVKPRTRARTSVEMLKRSAVKRRPYQDSSSDEKTLDSSVELVPPSKRPRLVHTPSRACAGPGRCTKVLCFACAE